jgi:hypothetical protein
VSSLSWRWKNSPASLEGSPQTWPGLSEQGSAQVTAKLKTASFTVRTMKRQSLRWKRAADAEGHRSVGTWIPEAVDRHLDALQRAGKPLPLAWGKGRFRVRLEDGIELELAEWMARPFGIFRGTAVGPSYHGRHLYTFANLPSLKLVATFRTARQG